jgi:hypothetical protein
MGETNDGYHNKATFVEVAKPAFVADACILYAKDDAGDTELFFEDEAGNEIQITKNNQLGGTGSFEVISIASGKAGAIQAASGKDLYLIMGDNVGANKISVMSSKALTNASQGNPCAITSVGHGLVTGDVVRLIDVGGMVELNNINYTVTKSTDDIFTLNTIDSTLYTAYTSGGRFCKEVDSFSSIPNISGAIVTSAGVLTSSWGNISTSATTGTGLYTITFKTAYSSVNDYVPVITCVDTLVGIRSAYIATKAVGSFTMKIITQNNSPINSAFNVIVMS